MHEEFSTELTRLALTWHVPGITHPDVPAIDLLSTILGDGRSSRLYRRLREEKGMVFGISAYSYTPGDPGLLGIDATLDSANRAEVEGEILELVREVQEKGVTVEELAKAKKISLGHSLACHHHAGTSVRPNWFITRNLNFTAITWPRSASLGDPAGSCPLSGRAFDDSFR